MEDNKIIKLLRETRSILLTIVIVLITVFLINMFLFRIVTVEGHSMDTNLANKDSLIMDRFTYHFRGPKRFEIVVFHHGDKLFIKRVIGMPGETVQIKNGKFYINGKELTSDTYGLEPISPDMYGRALHPVVLGMDEYFCVGDNRNHSGDSRLEEVGNVNRSLFVGRAIYRILPFSSFGKLNYEN